ncbi:MAG: hemerythrin domain-containing protein [Acidobacteria bacterium]|nr:hemerythrin domain-containing protein [Acidobacteriota bacterium]
MADVVTMIEQDHREVEKVFARLQSGDGDRSGLVDQLAVLLVPHTEAEEQVVYPLIAQAGVASFDSEEATQEHAEASTMLEELRGCVGDDGQFMAQLSELMEAIQHHVHEEEQAILPEWKQKTDPGTLEDVGRKFEAAKRQHMKAA